jgi:hypothetical protein
MIRSSDRVIRNKEDLLEVKILREPLVHFMFIGAAIYLLYGVFAYITIVRSWWRGFRKISYEG